MDSDQSAAKRLSRGSIQLGSREAEANFRAQLKKEQLKVTSDLKNAVSKSDITLIAVGAKIDKKNNPDCSEAQSVCKQVGGAMQKGSLVVYCGVAGFGFVDDVVKEVLEDTSGFKAGEDFGLAYTPSKNDFDEKVTLLAANDKSSLNSASLILEQATKETVVQVPSYKLAELSALFTATKKDANMALANELAVFCEKAKIDFNETQKLLSTPNCDTLKPSIAEEQNRVEASLLLDAAENLNVKLRLPLLARQVNEDMVRHAAGLVQEALREGGKTLRRARIALLGSAESGSSAATLVEQLSAKGAKISIFSTQTSENAQLNDSSVKRTLNEAVEASDCIILISKEEQFGRLNFKKLHAIMKSPATLVDLTGTVEPSKVQAAGFAYRGLGKGSLKK